MTAPDTMRLALMDVDDPPLIRCGDTRFNQWGRQVAECRMPDGHVADHVDVHQGHVWRDR